MTDEFTTIQINKEISRKLGELAKLNRRSKGAHISWMVEIEYAQALSEKKIPIVEADPQPATDPTNPNH